MTQILAQQKRFRTIANKEEGCSSEKMQSTYVKSSTRRTRDMTRDNNFGVQQSPRTELARTLLALADPIRMRMLNLMFAGELSPEQFARILGLPEKIISRHLMLFRESKMVSMQTKRNVKFYAIRSDPEFAATRLLRLAVGMIEHDSVLRSDLAVFYAIRQESGLCDPAPKGQISNAIQEFALPTHNETGDHLQPPTEFAQRHIVVQQ